MRKRRERDKRHKEGEGPRGTRRERGKKHKEEEGQEA